LADDVLISRQEYERLIEAMNSLDTKHRAVLVLRYFNDLSYEEIAQAVGIPLGTVKSRINHGLKLLRGQLDAQQREALG
ncbi:MAG: sigma-70 family RNA polymerase sigma factor, partial [Dehalococcoidales bacterium]|nr:sigma-70 family RNA polymerase sigma factor [Dehalococcoidales bacterium]